MGHSTKHLVTALLARRGDNRARPIEQATHLLERKASMGRMDTYLRRGIGMLLIAAVPAAHAALGDGAASVARDRDALRATAVTTSTFGNFDRHEMVTGQGATIREFADKSGTVFAVDFSGPAMPDLRTMLGTRYQAYVDAAKAQQRGHNHHVLSIQTDDMVLSIVRHPRGMQGQARLPALFPAGVTVEDLR
jgi:Protein of unknown function (DUF2844)